MDHDIKEYSIFNVCPVIRKKQNVFLGPFD